MYNIYIYCIYVYIYIYIYKYCTVCTYGYVMELVGWQRMRMSFAELRQISQFQGQRFSTISQISLVEPGASDNVCNFRRRGGGMGWQTRHTRHTMQTRPLSITDTPCTPEFTSTQRHTRPPCIQAQGTPGNHAHQAHHAHHASRHSGTASTACIHASRHPGTPDH